MAEFNLVPDQDSGQEPGFSWPFQLPHVPGNIPEARKHRILNAEKVFLCPVQFHPKTASMLPAAIHRTYALWRSSLQSWRCQFGFRVAWRKAYPSLEQEIRRIFKT